MVKVASSLSLSPSFTRRLPPAPRSHGQQKRCGGEPCTCSSGVKGMLRVDHVADHEKGLWSAARDDHPRLGSDKKNRARIDRKLVKYVD